MLDIISSLWVLCYENIKKAGASALLRGEWGKAERGWEADGLCSCALEKGFLFVSGGSGQDGSRETKESSSVPGNPRPGISLKDFAKTEPAPSLRGSHKKCSPDHQ